MAARRGSRAGARAWRNGHGREPEPLDDFPDCLAYVRAVHTGDQDGAAAAFDIVHLCLAGPPDAMVAPLNLACLIATRPRSPLGRGHARKRCAESTCGLGRHGTA